MQIQIHSWHMCTIVENRALDIRFLTQNIWTQTFCAGLNLTPLFDFVFFLFRFLFFLSYFCFLFVLGISCFSLGNLVFFWRIAQGLPKIWARSAVLASHDIQPVIVMTITRRNKGGQFLAVRTPNAVAKHRTQSLFLFIHAWYQHSINSIASKV